MCIRDRYHSIWAPSHSGIHGNEADSKVVKQTTLCPHTEATLRSISSDILNHITSLKGGYNYGRRKKTRTISWRLLNSSLSHDPHQSTSHPCRFKPVVTLFQIDHDAPILISSSTCFSSAAQTTTKTIPLWLPTSLPIWPTLSTLRNTHSVSHNFTLSKTTLRWYPRLSPTSRLQTSSIKFESLPSSL